MILRKVYNEKLLKRIIAVLTITLALLCCKESGTEPDPPIPLEKKAALTVEDHSLSELWLKLATENFTGTKNMLITRDEETAFEFTLSGTDTTIYNDSLKPSTSYNYSARIIDADNDTITTKTITARTRDTTSHNFTYQMWEFGEHSSSILYDVAIIDENNIWAVGEIYLMDSTGSYDPHAYNAIHWDGSNWEVKRIYYYGACSAVRYPPLKSIYAYSDTSIVLTNGGSIGWYDGKSIELDCRINPLLNGAIKSIWGLNKNDFYAAGGNGSLARYNGTEWTKIETGTELTLTDIYGTDDGDVYAAGVDRQYIKGIILKVNEIDGFRTMITSEVIGEDELFSKLYGSLSAVWLDERNTFYCAGTFLYRFREDEWNYVTSFPNNNIGGNPIEYRGYITSINGNGSNDWVISGERNTLYHFNGSTWRKLGTAYNSLSEIRWLSITQKNNIVVAVGDIGSKAAIILLER